MDPLNLVISHLAKALSRAVASLADSTPLDSARRVSLHLVFLNIAPQTLHFVSPAFILGLNFVHLASTSTRFGESKAQKRESEIKRNRKRATVVVVVVTAAADDAFLSVYLSKA